MKEIAPLHYISHATERTSLPAQLTAVIAGGVRWIQFRQKKADDHQFMEEAQEALILCRNHQVKLIINDRVSIAKTIGADGVHLGKEDMSPIEARRLLGEDKIIGCTANTFDDILTLAQAPIDYIGLGPFRFTRTKEKLSPVLGLEGYRQTMKKLADRSFNIPIIAIGGIGIVDVIPLFELGVQGIAVSNALLDSPDITGQARLFLEAIHLFTAKQRSLVS